MEREVQSSKASLPKLFNIEFSSKVTVCNFLHESNAPKRIDSTLAGISIDSKPDEADPFSCLSENVHNSIVFNFDGFSKVMSNGLQTKTSIKSIFIYHSTEDGIVRAVIILLSNALDPIVFRELGKSNFFRLLQ